MTASEILAACGLSRDEVRTANGRYYRDLDELERRIERAEKSFEKIVAKKPRSEHGR